MNSAKVIQFLGGRKFIMTAVVFLFSTALVLMKRLESAAYYDVMKLLITGYPLGNVTQSLLVNKLNITTEQEQTADLLGGRMFILSVVIYMSIAILYMFEYLEVKAYVDLSYWIVCSYIIGNISSKAVESGVSITIDNKKENKE